MSRPPRARETVLDAFEQVVRSDGERGATMDAVARVAGVSKGGLLYHFASKDALENGVIERMEERAVLDVEQIVAASDGPVAAFMRSSIMTDSPLDRSIIAVSRLAQNGHPLATDALRRVRDMWEGAIRPHVRDESALQLVMLVSDGLYFNNALTVGALPGPKFDEPELAALIALVEHSTHA
ncbi:AcrR family transcriptional regulator [Microbacterium halimionae]|uniref:AcrR family transcriptional regulator n=1 Tax=Microbacterium halimionae TaxID=1526413 RepID=A0A7W3JQY4_9MICO|nr:TetR/AcrR family transcriptional regulator [Microbacterium halimionae]MBA8817404.1 AcrR family transcriptional regulator [Microbacterium halimionae]NII96038.1 AcrR family transcriptional regulator [Microbacterium halimionae]